VGADGEKTLEADLKSWTAGWNEDPRPFVWRKTADEILESLGRYCETSLTRLTSPTAQKPGQFPLQGMAYPRGAPVNGASMNSTMAAPIL
jgi:hypothetical protein